MPHPVQKVKGLRIQTLKGLMNLDIDFEPHLLTAIMGVNGCGKTTILHALACFYKPYNGHGSHNYKFSKFFTPNTDSRWTGSKFELQYEHELSAELSQVYGKSSDRWSPRYESRLPRWVSYVGIRSAVPEIEELKSHTFINLAKVTRNDPKSNQILAAASFVLNRNYVILTSNTRGNKSIIGVRYKNVDYSAISMGSGEQRVFRILEEAHNAVDYGLLLIDEIELLLHTDALKRLLMKLDEIARAKHLQIVFTSHSEVILLQKDMLNIRHVFIAENGDALCVKQENPNLIYSLTGHQERPLKIFVEDELSRQIVEKISKEVGIRKYVEIGLFGPAINAFTISAGVALSNANLDMYLFVIDGDLYVTRDEKKQQIGRVLTGTTYALRRKKVAILQCVTEFALPPNKKPEQFFHEAISSLAPLPDEEYEELRQAAIHIQAVDDSHHLIDSIVSRMGYSLNEYGPIIGLLSTQPWWQSYTRPIRSWLLARRAALNLT